MRSKYLVALCAPKSNLQALQKVQGVAAAAELPLPLACPTKLLQAQRQAAYGMAFHPCDQSALKWSMAWGALLGQGGGTGGAAFINPARVEPWLGPPLM